MGKRAEQREARYLIRSIMCLRMELFTGSTHSNWGSLAWFWKQIRGKQDESQAESKQCQVADESVVVNKFRPVKASNGVEDKTGMI